MGKSYSAVSLFLSPHITSQRDVNSVRPPITVKGILYAKKYKTISREMELMMSRGAFQSS